MEQLGECLTNKRGAEGRNLHVTFTVNSQSALNSANGLYHP